MGRRRKLRYVVMAGEGEYRDERKVHVESAPGQQTSVLCGWEGGRYLETVEEGAVPLTCSDCEAIVALFRG